MSTRSSFSLEQGEVSHEHKKLFLMTRGVVSHEQEE